jgi:hypothetical protein
MDRNIIPPTGTLSSTTTARRAGTVRSWLRRDQTRSVKLKLDGDALDLRGLSSGDRLRLIDAWIRRHAEKEGAGQVGKQPQPQDQAPETVEDGSVGEAEQAEATEPQTLTHEEMVAEVERHIRDDLLQLQAPMRSDAGVTVQEEVVIEQTVKPGDDYASRLLKYIPTETVAAYLALSGVVASAAGQNRAAMLWAVFVFGLLLTPLYLRRVGNVRSWLQLGISTAAFVVWVFALGGPWSSLSWYEPYQGTLLLIAFTTTAPLVIPVPPSLHSAPAAG